MECKRGQCWKCRAGKRKVMHLLAHLRRSLALYSLFRALSGYSHRQPCLSLVRRCHYARYLGPYADTITLATPDLELCTAAMHTGRLSERSIGPVPLLWFTLEDYDQLHQVTLTFEKLPASCRTSYYGRTVAPNQHHNHSLTHLRACGHERCEGQM